ncbi:MAG TPA: MgtC/SapB family protein [Caulobacteraceae bacterium]|nr:MgtC/SapB family protein [Caulobacteraceae bacterium]
MLSQWELVARLLLAAGLGSVVGLERERLQWAAGLRTHMLVSVGSCLIIIVSAYGFRSVLSQRVVLDPSRIAAQVVTGVGFLGAGSIILRNEAIKGLTTAASIWAVAGIGLASGAGLYSAAVVTTLIILVILAGLKPLEERFRASRTNLELHIKTRRGDLSLGRLEQALGGRAGRVKQIVVRPAEDDALDDVTLLLTRVSAADTADIVRKLKAVDGVLQIGEANA